MALPIPVMRKTVIAIAVFGAAVLVDGRVTTSSGNFGFGVCQAEARVGRPATPMSVAGVARRSSRRAFLRYMY